MIAAPLLLTVLSACSLRKFTVNMTAEIFKDSARSFNEESDFELARLAAPALLKTSEGLLEAAPENKTVLALTAEGFCAYAFAFLGEELESLSSGDPAVPVLRARATLLYTRCEQFGRRLLALEDTKRFPGALDGTPDVLRTAVAKLDEGAVPGLFWTATGMASRINLNNRDNILLVVDLAKVEILMERVIELNEGYYNAGAHLALGTLYGSFGKAIGGNPELARKHFDRAISLTGGEFLLNRVFLARIFAVTVQDRALFEQTLREVLETPPDIMLAQRLANEVARRKAARYLAQVEELFE